MTRRSTGLDYSSRTKKALWIGISVFLVMVLAAGGIVGSFLWKLNNSFQQAETIEVEQVFPAEETRPAPATVAPEAQNILLLGSGLPRVWLTPDM